MAERDDQGRFLPGHAGITSDGNRPTRFRPGHPALHPFQPGNSIGPRFQPGNSIAPILLREANPGWRGDLASYSGLHRRVYRARGKAAHRPCAHCGKQARHWAHLHSEPPGDVMSYTPLCVPCHRRYDNGGCR